MERMDVNRTTKKLIENILKKHNEDCDVSFMVDEISIVGDLIEYDKNADILSVYLKCSDLYSFFDERSDEELMADAKEEIKKIDDFHFVLSTKDCPYKHENIDSFINKNTLRYQIELKDSDLPNIFNNEALRGSFTALASNQRGFPEHEMREAQKTLGGGIYPDLLEHIGDLTHRMAQATYINSGDVHYGINDMYSKIEKGIVSLKEGDGFQSELQRNRLSNFEYNKETTDDFKYNNYEDFDKVCNEHSERYKKEHCKLKVYNDMQHEAKYAAIHLGNGDFGKALTALKVLKTAIDDGSYSKKASMYDSSFEYNNLNLVVNKIKTNYKNELKKLIIKEEYGVVTLSDIVLHKEFRDEGIGSKIMSELATYCRVNKLIVRLEPNEKNLEYGTKSKAKLINFYKKNGFIENKGSRRDKDFSDNYMLLDCRPTQKNKVKLK